MALLFFTSCYFFSLGYDEETFESLYKEHDIVLNLDVDLLPDDIELVYDTNTLNYFSMLPYLNLFTD